MTTSCAGILLAAGSSTRFGADKLLHPLRDGTPMAVAAARRLAAVLTERIAVVADAQGELAGLLEREGFRVVVNEHAADGMGTSITCGVAASRSASGWVIALADMPCIPEAVIRAVVDGLERGADLIAPVCNGQRGHPVGFAARHGPALLQLQGDTGARGIIAANRESLELIETADTGVLLDVDHPESLHSL